MAEVFQTGDWACLRASREVCQVVDRETAWGAITYQVWLPARDAVVRVPEGAVAQIHALQTGGGTDHVAYVAATARIADALGRDTLIAPLEGRLVPLPHQIHALSRALGGDRIRYLLADEVGLGKTIEAGLILRELKIRGLVRRALVVAPTGLVTQWVQEMRTHFGESFRLVIPGDFGALRQLAGLDESDNVWRFHDQVVCPLDAVKPVESRRGWTHEQLARYNRERFEDLVTAGWDLVIVDEAHRLAASSTEVARFKLGEALSQAAPYVLLLTATPHQGKTDGFLRLLRFLDRETFADETSISRERVAPFVIRTEKRQAIDDEGRPLFQPRHVQLLTASWSDGQRDQRALYGAVTEYVRHGYNQAIRDKRSAIGFLMLLMQRLVSSSTRAIRTALEKRLDVLELPEGQLSLFADDIGAEWPDLDGQEQMETLLAARLKGISNERAEVEQLLSLARRCEATGPDSKAQALLDRLRQLERDENDPDLKVLLFTEFVPTQAMLAEFLRARGFTVACLNGSMTLDERQDVQVAFARQARVLVSTDAGGEGLNLQFCHVVVNYDLPWNPMKIEQRIGRVDRIGQAHVVRAVNVTLTDTVEHRVREVLEDKLQRILADFGADKLGDVLDSETTGVELDDVYARAVIEPAGVAGAVDSLADALRERARAAREGLQILGGSVPPDAVAARKLVEHHLPRWTERMTVSYLRSRADAGTFARSGESGYRLRWEDGTEVAVEQLSIEDVRVRALVTRTPVFAPGQPVGSAVVPGVSDKVTGTWSLWRIALESAEERMERVLPLFLSDDNRVLAPTARIVWDRLIEAESTGVEMVPGRLDGAGARDAFDRSRRAAEEHGAALYRELLARYLDRLKRERKKAEHAFDARRRAIDRLGLAQVQQHRRRQLDTELRAWETRTAAREHAWPALRAIIVLRVAEPRAS